MTRLVAVLCMIYVHVPDGQSERVLHAMSWLDATSLLQGLLIEGPGRAGASLLSIVSGYLTAKILLGKCYSISTLYKRRFRSILVPMFIWSLASYTVYSIASVWRVTFIDDASTLLDHLNILFFLTDIPHGATMHLAFLRDLFVCIVLSPLLIMGLRRAPILLLSLLACLYLGLHQHQGLIVLRPLVLFAFSIGLYLALRNTPLDAVDHRWRLWVGLTVLLALLVMMSNGNQLASAETALASVGVDLRETILYPLCRLFGSLAIWTLMPVVFRAKSFKRAHRLAPYVFTTFCSHQLVLNCIYEMMWVPWFGTSTDGVYIVWFVMAPILSLLMGIAVVHAASAVTADLGMMIAGGRKPSLRFDKTLSNALARVQNYLATELKNNPRALRSLWIRIHERYQTPDRFKRLRLRG